MSPIPYVVGQWVRGDQFYGRSALIEEILEGHRNTIWLLGTRRIGKTSLLKQIEHIADTSENHSYFPIFWDFQGAEVPEELHLNFADALLDADERLERIGIDLDDVVAEDLFVSLGRLRRRLRTKNLGLLLLCDEVEELIKLQSKDPSLLRKLLHVMQSSEDIRSVLASTIRLWALAGQKEDTSSFLHGFTPPLFIERFSDEEARSLIAQSQLGSQERPQFTNVAVETIQEHCGNHPYLVQLVCKRYLETGRLEEAITQVSTDRMVSYFFSVDFEMLSEAEGGIIQIIARNSEVSSNSIREELSMSPDALEGNLRRLENLGFISKNKQRGFVVANYFFRRWLHELPDQATPGETALATVPTTTSKVDLALAEDNTQSAGGWIAELKRRNVARVGIVYIAVAWVMLQVGEIVFNFLEIPTWAGKLLIVFLTLGLPIALILAWAFELTTEGIKREKDVDRAKNTMRQTGRKLDIIIIAVLVIAVVLFVLYKFF